MNAFLADAFLELRYGLNKMLNFPDSTGKSIVTRRVSFEVAQSVQARSASKELQFFTV